jgi:UDP-N-acetyl-D-mannosaminuronic acid dehydrogenase
MSTAMMLQEGALDSPEKRRKYTVSVVGCGRIGLPTACLFAEAGFKVIGADVNPQVVALINKGKAPFSETSLETLLEKHVKKGFFNATTNLRKAAAKSDIIVFVVPTPIDKKKKPEYSFIESPSREIGMGLRAGSIVIVASTTGPGVTETLVKETLENASGLRAGVDFGLAYSPTRAAPGQVLRDVAYYPRIVGAIDERSLKVASIILSTIVKGGIIKVRDMKTAEAIKLFENIYRDVNIALANDLAEFCEKAGIDYLEAQKAANTQPFCHLLMPGIVGGHIPKDPYLLLEEAENLNTKLRLPLLARKINDEKPAHAIRLVREALKHCGRPLRRAKIAILGVSYRPNVKEPRGSKTEELVKKLRAKGATVQVYDPFYSQKELTELGYPAQKTLAKTVEGTDCLIIAVGHDRFKRLNLRRIKHLMKKSSALVDLGHVTEPKTAEKEGFIYRGIGRGVWSK